MIDSQWRKRRGARVLASWSGALSVLALAVGCSSDGGSSGGSAAGSGGSPANAGSSGSVASAGSSAAGATSSAGSSTGGTSAGGSTSGGSAGSAAVAGESGAADSAAGDTGSGGNGGDHAGTGGVGGVGGTAPAGGTGGNAVGGAGTGGATSGSGGTGGTGGSSGGAAIDPDGAIVTGSALTAVMQGTQGSPDNTFAVWDTCPDDQVVIGFKEVGFNDFISGLQAVCGKLTVTKTTQLQVSITPGATLLARGGSDPQNTASALCPANSVVVGFSGKLDDRLRRLALTCAPVILEFQDGAPTVGLDLDNEAALPAIGPLEQGGDFAFTGCPDGQIARGSQMTEGEFRNPNGWLESLALVCGTPSLTFPNGTACTSVSDCDSRACSTTCQALTCDAPTGCTCKQFEGKPYAFCPQTAASDAATAEGVCETKAMHLAWVTDSSTNGWLRSAANASGVGDDAYIGVDDLVTHGTWSLEPAGTTATFTSWGGGDYGLEPNCLDGVDCNGEIENCVTVRGDGAWNNVNCTGTHAFVCSN